MTSGYIEPKHMTLYLSYGFRMYFVYWVLKCALKYSVYFTNQRVKKVTRVRRK